jgi:hypothetical protein
MHLAAVDHLRTLADASSPLAVGVYRDAQVRAALKLAAAACERTVTDQIERDEALLAAAALHELLSRAAEILATLPGPMDPDGSWHVHTLTREVHQAVAQAPDETGRRLLGELTAARAWRDSARAMASACDHDDPGAAKQWATTLRVAEQAWQEAAPAPVGLPGAGDVSMSRPPAAIMEAQAEDAATGADRAQVWRVVPWLWIVVGYAFATWGATNLLAHPDQLGWNLVELLIGAWNIANGIRWLPTARSATVSADLAVLEEQIAANQQTLAGLIAAAEGKDHTIAELETATARKDHEIADLRRMVAAAEQDME